MIPVWSLPLLPALGAVSILVAGSRPASRGAPPGGDGTASARVARGTLGALATGTAVVTLMFAVAFIAQPSEASFRWGGQLWIELSAHGFARIMLVLVPLIAACVLVYASVEEEADGLPRLLALLCAFLGAMELLVLANDLLSLLIAFELVGACSWALIGHRWRARTDHPYANQAFLATRVGDLGLFLAAGAAFSAGGSVTFATLDTLPAPALHVVAAGVLLAAAAKSAQVPFAPWLFSAMRGPTPVSALLHSATMVAAGAYVLIRLSPPLELTGWFGPAVALLGLGTAVSGGVVASLHRDIKKALAASTSAQYGLMFVAVGAGSVAAASLHLVAHAAFKALLFLGAGLAIHAAGSADLSRMKLGSSLVGTRVLFAVGTLSLAAVPPLGGAFTKEAIVEAASTRSPLLGGGVLAAGFLSAFYAGRLQVLAFGAGERSELPHPRWLSTLSVGVLAAVSLLLGLLWFPPGESLAERTLATAMPHGPAWAAPLSVATVAAGLATVWWLGARGQLLSVVRVRAAARLPDTWLGLAPATGPWIAGSVERLAARLALLDDRAIDAGVRAAARAGSAISRLMSSAVEIRADRVVGAVATGARALARGSRDVDERGVDGSVEALGRGVGFGGRHVRRLQTGLVHHYYVLLAAGFAAVVLMLLWQGVR